MSAFDYWLWGEITAVLVMRRREIYNFHRISFAKSAKELESQANVYVDFAVNTH